MKIIGSMATKIMARFLVFRGGIWGGVEKCYMKSNFILCTSYQISDYCGDETKKGETECTREMYAEDKKICHFD